MAKEQSNSPKTGDGLFSYDKPPMTTKEIAANFQPDPEEVVEEEPIVKKQTDAPLAILPKPATQQQMTQVNLTFDLPPARPAKRRQSGDKTFSQKHALLSLSYDNRIQKEVEEFFERGARMSGNKTVFASQLLLKLLLNAGYKLDPNMLADPE